MSSIKKLYLLFFVLILLAVIFLFLQLNKAKKINVTPADNPILSANMVNIPLTNSDPEPLGNPGAEITIVEFTDFNDANNRAVHVILENFVRAHADQARLFIKDAPGISLISDSTLPHRAAFCAFKQKKYWPFVSALLQDKNNLKIAGINNLVKNLKLNQTAFDSCLNSPEAKNKTTDSTEFLKQLGIKYTPAIFLNNKLLNLDKDLDLQQLLEQLVK